MENIDTFRPAPDKGFVKRIGLNTGVATAAFAATNAFGVGLGRAFLIDTSFPKKFTDITKNLGEFVVAFPSMTLICGGAGIAAVLAASWYKSQKASQASFSALAGAVTGLIMFTGASTYSNGLEINPLRQNIDICNRVNTSELPILDIQEKSGQVVATVDCRPK